MIDDLEKRLERAREAPFEVFVVSDDPYVIEIDSDSDNTYTVVPNIAYCSCEDRRYRQVPCKHLLAIGLGNVDVNRDVREELLDGIETGIDQLEDDEIWWLAKDLIQASINIDQIQEKFGGILKGTNETPWTRDDIDSFIETTDRARESTEYTVPFGNESDDSDPEDDKIGRIAGTARLE